MNCTLLHPRRKSRRKSYHSSIDWEDRSSFIFFNVSVGANSVLRKCCRKLNGPSPALMSDWGDASGTELWRVTLVRLSGGSLLPTLDSRLNPILTGALPGLTRFSLLLPLLKRPLAGMMTVSFSFCPARKGLFPKGEFGNSLPTGLLLH